MLTATVTSSNIARFAWQEGNLHVLFNNGREYTYSDAPESMFHDWASAESAGKFFHSFVKSLDNAETTGKKGSVFTPEIEDVSQTLE